MPRTPINMSSENPAPGHADWLDKQVSTWSTKLPLLVDLLRWAQSPRWSIEDTQDLLAFRQAHRAFRVLPPPANANTAVLVVQRDDAFDVKCLYLLAAGARMLKHPVVAVVPSRRFRRAVRILRTSGVVTKFYFHDELLSSDERREAATWAAITARADLDEIMRARFRGIALGWMAISTLIRREELSDVSALDDGLRAKLATHLTRAAENAMVADRVFQAHPKPVAFVHEPGYVGTGPFVDAALVYEGCAVHVSAGWRDDGLFLKRLTTRTRSMLPTSVDVTTLERDCSKPWSAEMEDELEEAIAARYGGRWRAQAQYQAKVQHMSVEAVRAKLGVADDRPIGVIFAHVLWDATFWGGEGVFDSYARWLVESVRAAAANPALTWVVKAHPNNLFRHGQGDVTERCAELRLLTEAFPKLPSHVTVLRPETDVSSLSLYHAASLGMTVRGMPGLEMASMGKAVITGGTGPYSGFGFTHDPTSSDEFRAMVGRAHELAPPKGESLEHAKRYLRLLLARRTWLLRGWRPTTTDGPWRPLRRNLAPIGPVSVESPDLAAAARWALRTVDIDYLEEAVRT